jgi:electron transport complex protein RnfD
MALSGGKEAAQDREVQAEGEREVEWKPNRNRLELVLYHLFAGGLMLGALFMATDMVTSPLTRKGQIIFGAGCGILTALLRYYSGMPEGVCYSILLMNTACPLIDRHTRPRVFGETRK